MKLLLTIIETAEVVSMSESKIRRLMAEKRFPLPVTIDGNRRWRMRDLEEWESKLIAGELPPARAKRGRPRLAV